MQYDVKGTSCLLYGPRAGAVAARCFIVVRLQTPG
jgi:hypothetical protein